MRQQCINATEAALGRPLTVAQARGIEQRIGGAMRYLARKDPARWVSMTAAQRMAGAGKQAARELVDEMRLANERLRLAIEAKTRITDYVEGQVQSGDSLTRVEALQRLLSPRYDKRSNVTSVEAHATAIFDNEFRGATDAMEKLRPSFWDFLQGGTQAKQVEFINALAGLSTDPDMNAAAKLLQDSMERMRQRFNSAGGAIGKLENYALPQTWSWRLASRRGHDDFVEDFMRFVDRSKYYHEDGTRFSDQDMRDFLGAAYMTIATNGATKLGKARDFGSGSMRANRGREHRALHLKPDMLAEALGTYSELGPVDAVTAHMRQMARDIALIETFGPNADLLFEQTLTDAIKLDSAAVARSPKTGVRVGGQDIDVRATLNRSLYNAISGREPLVTLSRTADAFAISRSIHTASLMGSAVLTSITDNATMIMRASENRLNLLKLYMTEAGLHLPQNRRIVKRMGLMTDAVLGAVDHFASTNVTVRDYASRTATAVIRMSGLQYITETRRAAFQIAMMDAIGHLSRRYQTMAALRQDDHFILRSKGVSEDHFAVWRAAKLEAFGAHGKVLTPDAIMAVPNPSITGIAQRLGVTPERVKLDAVEKLMAVLREERDIAVTEPNAKERNWLAAGLAKNTTAGEIVRAAMQFKTFAIAFTNKNLDASRAYVDDGRGGRSLAPARMVYAGALLGLSTVFGAIATWIIDLVNGREMRSMNPNSEHGVANIVAAAARGGGIGFYSDILFASAKPGSNPVGNWLAGPTGGTVGDAIALMQTNRDRALSGDEVNWGPDALRTVQRLTPGANLWYSKALVDRNIFLPAQEAMQPGYRAKLQARQFRQRGTDYYFDLDQSVWDGDPLPDEAPEIAAAVAE